MVRTPGAVPHTDWCDRYQRQDYDNRASSPSPESDQLRSQHRHTGRIRRTEPSGPLDGGVTHVVMETSSHSLDQGRLDGLSFAAAVYTNLTRDHLDYHGSMEAYLASKLRLSTLLRLGGVEVVNLDDDAWRALPDSAPRTTFGLHPAADVRATQIVLHASGSR